MQISIKWIVHDKIQDLKILIMITSLLQIYTFYADYIGKDPTIGKKSLNWMKAFDSHKKDITSFIAKWSSKICKPKEYLCEWKSWSKERKVLEEENQMQTSEKSAEIPRLKELTRLRQQFVFVPIDKAANNIGFICKKYFLEALHQETISNTYVPY